ncbi:uncharacterized protein KD926_011669 [Aspergillus affinis]|uniref:uncharacterized protein n=1 Tax=Aspergillus affinis TaxID=1070780 RepID=UPI0022FDCAFA|nr:uncharacterized protein KD926_011669 [Aspergillus affinis]KAI9044699.1 hypothetical protein KD926_011669 [Aspergillus affinis]
MQMGLHPSSAYSIDGWKVKIEQWLPPDDFHNLDPVAKKVNVTVDNPGPHLKSWLDLGLQNVSGIGYYSATFQWASNSTHPLHKSGAYLILPTISHGIVGFINGKKLPPFDITNPRLHITSYLKTRSYTVDLRVSSTLWNGIMPYWNDHYGIIGDVVIEPYARYTII